VTESIPREWFANTDDKLNFFIIAELGLIKPPERAAALDQVTGKMWPLVNDDLQSHLVSEGPWLIQIDLDQFEQIDISPLADASHAWIAGYSEGAQLSRQLAPAMCCLSPANEVRLLRFYCPEIIKILKDQTDHSWFDEFFSTLVSWYWRSENGDFQIIFDSPLTTKSGSSDKWILAADENLWSELIGNPEVDSLINSLTKDVPEVFEGLNGAAKRQRVKSCLAKADEIGVVSADDRKIYVYLEMATGGDLASSDEIAMLAKRAVSDQKPLIELVEHSMEQGVS